MNQPGRSFRRRKRTPEEIAAEKDELLKLYAKRELSLSFANLYGTKDDPKAPVIIIDGYNLLHKIMKNEPHRYYGLSLDLQRARFEMDLLEYSRYNSVRITVAYDAAGYLGDDFSQALGVHRIPQDVDTFYCFDCDADSGILIEVDRLVGNGYRQILVVSSDNEVRVGAFRPPKVFVKSSEMFLEEMLTTKVEAQQMVKDHNQTMLRNGLKSSMTQETLQGLTTMRDSLIVQRREKEVKKREEQREEKEREKKKRKEERRKKVRTVHYKISMIISNRAFCCFFLFQTM